jgi:excisionase family DNA binding protein
MMQNCRPLADGVTPAECGSDKLLLTVEEAAHLTGISRSHAYKQVSRGFWPSVSIGRSRRVPRSWLSSLVDETVQEWQTAHC